MQPSEEIKTRLNIVDVVKDYVRLQAAGVNFKGKCPFHSEKSPSFIVSPDKQIFHCFGCGAGGDVFAFITRIENITFVEALRFLAPKAGVVLRSQNPEQASKRNRMLDMMDLSRRYYHDLLLNSPQAQGARQYLQKRGLGSETIEEWQIGFSPDGWDALYGLLRKRGYDENEIFAAGLTVKSSKSNKFFDRFRARIMFPINDPSGHTVAFSARVSPEREATEQMGKYINSPQTPLYDKGSILFGLDKAKQAIKSENLAIVVEGQMDAISSHQAGFKNTVASSGTALTSGQLQLIRRFTNNLALCFDADAAGETAAERGIRQAWREDMETSVISVPQGKDPDECIRKDPAAWRRAIQERRPAMRYFFDKASGGTDLSKVQNKRSAVSRLLPLVAGMANPIEKDYWLRELGALVDVGEGVLKEAMRGAKSAPRAEPQAKSTPPQARPAALSREESASQQLLALVLRYGAYFPYMVNNLDPDYLEGVINREFYKNLIIYYNNAITSVENEAGWLVADQFRQWLRNYLSVPEYCQEQGLGEETGLKQASLLDRLLIRGELDYAEIGELDAKPELIKYISLLKKNKLSQKMRSIEKGIARAEESGRSEEADSLIRELGEIAKELRGL